ncbi:hypothetical protein Sru01_41450 [Sphaerisporangium rufum]|uniref:Gas vesicle protein n=1 Tax=Sphaerisporangium rufum TaxID=1381558 RepID=A0A919R4W2_9ACTN|nr:gas vesicle protein [Sphaerisporangium rufum]GII79163.1 hypothetical protein Sru01_41450 [Sphaerisporangium rufum]
MRDEPPAEAYRVPPERVALVDLLDRLLAGGVVITGDVVLSIADIDLVRISLRALLVSVRAGPALELPGTGPTPGLAAEPTAPGAATTMATGTATGTATGAGTPRESGGGTGPAAGRADRPAEASVPWSRR